VVECQLPKLDVAGSTPVARSILSLLNPMSRENRDDRGGSCAALDSPDWLRTLQVKEKYGTLRFYHLAQLSVLRLMPRDEMREAKVDGFIASSFAAPPGPETLPLVCFKAFIIVSRSCRFNSSRVRSAASAVGFGC
jgi:hypothetical protein